MLANIFISQIILNGYLNITCAYCLYMPVAYVNDQIKQYEFFKHRLIIFKILIFFYDFKYIKLYFLNVYLCIILLKI